MNEYILKRTVGFIVVLIPTIYFLYCIFIRKGFNEKKNVSVVERKIMYTIATICMLIILIPAFKDIVIPYMQDLKYIITKEYPTVHGKIKEITFMGNEQTDAIITFENGNVKEIEIFTTETIEENSEVEIRYLPHLKAGELVE